MATKTVKVKWWGTATITTNADWSRSVSFSNNTWGWYGWNTYTWSAWWSVTATNNSTWKTQTYSSANDAITSTRNNYNTTNNTTTNTTPTINLWDLGKFGADAYNTPNFNIDARNDAIIKWLWANATNRSAVEAYLNSNASFQNASETDKQNTINSILRKAATVATADNPVVDYLTNQESLVYDMNDPQDYLDRLQARTALTGQQLTQEEYYNMLKAQRAIQEQQYKNPYEDYMKQLQQQLEQARAREQQRDEEAVKAYQSRLDSQYWDLINQQRQWWQASQQSAQNVYSFSGFGRSSAAANKAAEIQDSTNRAIQALNQQKLAEIELKRAELEWADGDELTYLKNQMNTLSQATTEWQLKALSEMAQANAQAGNDAVTSITNMLAAAANSWIDITWDGYERIITAFNWMTPEQQDAYLNTLSPTDQLLVLWWAANSADGSYKFISWSKYQKAWYFNEKTWEFFPLSWGGSYGWGGGWWNGGWNWGGGSSEWWTWEAGEIQSATARSLNQLYNIPRWARNGLSWESIPLIWKATKDVLETMKWEYWDASSAYNYLRQNLTLNKFLDAKKNWATFGSMSEWEWDILAKSATKLSWKMTDEEWKATIQEIANNMWVQLTPKTYDDWLLTKLKNWVSNLFNKSDKNTSSSSSAVDIAKELWV